jgi:hypothetical protein
MISRRREERTTVSAQIRIWGMDANGKPFSVPATTYDLTRFGARVMGIRIPLAPGEIVGVQHGSEKARFRVAWYGRPGSRLEGNVGLQALDWKKHIWGSLVQDSPHTLVGSGDQPLNNTGPTYASGIDPLLERMDSDAELAPLRRAVPVPAPPSPSALARLVAAERRLATRYTCAAQVEITTADSANVVNGRLREMSLVGCFIHTAAEFPHRAAINLSFRPFGMQITCGAQVRHIEQGVGFGVKFTSLTEAERAKLETAIERLAEEGAALIPEKPSGPRPPQSRTQQFVSAVEKLTSAIREIEGAANAHAVALSPQLVRSFRTQAEQARQAGFALQQWMEFQDQRKDPTPLLSEAENRRLRANLSVLRDLLSEAEGENFSVERPAVAELYAAAVAVYRRLAWLAERKHPTSAEK